MFMVVVALGVLSLMAHAQRGRGLRSVATGVRTAVSLGRSVQRISGGRPNPGRGGSLRQRTGRGRGAHGGGAAVRHGAGGRRRRPVGVGAARVASRIRAATHRNRLGSHRKGGSRASLRTGAAQQSTGTATPTVSEAATSSVTPEERDALKNEIMRLIQGPQKPDPAQIDSLAGHLAEALARKNLSGPDRTRLMNAVGKALNEALQAGRAASDLQAALTAAGVSQTDAQTVADDLKTLASSPQK